MTRTERSQVTLSRKRRSNKEILLSNVCSVRLNVASPIKDVLFVDDPVCKKLPARPALHPILTAGSTAAFFTTSCSLNGVNWAEAWGHVWSSAKPAGLQQRNKWVRSRG